MKRWGWFLLAFVLAVAALGAWRVMGARKVQVAQAAAAAQRVEPVVELAATDVVPAQARELQRGVDRGEFRPLDLEYTVFSIVAPMMFLIMMKHSLGACAPQEYPLDPQRYIDTQVDNLLQGLCVRPGSRP